MMKAFIKTLFCLFISFYSFAQNSEAFLRQQYQASQQVVSKNFKEYFNQNANSIYSLAEEQFILVVDSLRNSFQTGLTDYKARVKDKEYVENEETGIRFFFDKLILDYPYFHEINTSEKLTLSSASQKRLDKNLIYLNNPKLLNQDDVKQYIISQGISESRITSAGHGETTPIADNKTAAGRQKNRRVELKLSYY